MANKISAIIGLGWLGKPLALDLKKAGFNVYAGTRDLNKISEYNELGFTGFQISYDLDLVHIHLDQKQLNEISNLIICIPPTGFKNYATTLGLIVSKFNDNTKIIFTSSTGIYVDLNCYLTEESDKIQDHPVYQAEQKLLELAASRLTILRLAGLIGENRHPVKYFIQKNRIPNSNAPVNLVHQKDVIHAILLVLKNEIFGKIFNIVNPSHLSKKDYYLAAAKELFNEIPITEDGKGGKLVLGTKFDEEIRFKYNFPIDDWNELRKTN